MFDFTPVGLGIAVAGVVFLAFGYRLLPRDRQGAADLDEALDIEDYVDRGAASPQGSRDGRADGRRAAQARPTDEVAVTAIVAQRATAAPGRCRTSMLRAGRHPVLLEGEPTALERARRRGRAWS